MKAFILVVAMCAALTGCKKENKAAEGSAAAPAAAGSAAVAPAAANDPAKAAEAAGSAMEAAAKAAEAAGSAAAMAGSAAEMGAAAAEAGAKAAAAAAAMSAGANVPRPATVTDAQVALADKFVVAMTKMGTDVGAAGKDCAKAAAAITATVKELEPLKAEIDKMQDLTEKDAQAKAWFEATYAPKMMAAMGPMMGIAQTCGTDKAFMDAMKKLDEKH